MFLNATGAGVEKVMAPTKNANIARLTPLARKFVGKTSAAQITAGASTHFSYFSICQHGGRPTNLEECDEEEYEQYAGRIATSTVRTQILPLK